MRKIIDVRNPSFKIKKASGKRKMELIQAVIDLEMALIEFEDAIEDPASPKDSRSRSRGDWEYIIGEIVDEVDNLMDFIKDKLSELKPDYK